MIRISKFNISLAFALIGLPTMLFFQNCSQAGSLSVDSALALNASEKTSDTLIIVPPDSDSQQNSDNSIIQLDDPKSTSPVTNRDGTIANAACAGLEISDILLHVASISLNSANPKEVALEIIDKNKSISLDKLNLKIKAHKNENAHEIFLLLSPDGNKVLSAQNVAMDLKTPSAQNSGLKIKLAQDVQIEDGQMYNLELVINPSEQIVNNNNKCIFKPVVQEAHLKLI